MEKRIYACPSIMTIRICVSELIAASPNEINTVGGDVLTLGYSDDEEGDEACSMRRSLWDYSDNSSSDDWD